MRDKATEHSEKRKPLNWIQGLSISFVVARRGGRLSGVSEVDSPWFLENDFNGLSM